MAKATSEQVDRVHGAFKRVAINEIAGQVNALAVVVSTVLIANGFSTRGRFFIYETRVFGGPFSEAFWRTRGRDEAIKKHEEAVLLASGSKPD